MGEDLANTFHDLCFYIIEAEEMLFLDGRLYLY